MSEASLDLAIDGSLLHQLRTEVAASAVQAGLPKRRAEDLVIAAHELAANVVRHGSGRGRLRIWTHDRVLHCQVSDERVAGPARSGKDTAPESGERGQRAADPSTWGIEPGHGLWLVRQLADRTSLHPGPAGPAVTISFSLGPAGPLPPFTLGERPGRAATVLSVTGLLDLNAAGQLTDAIERALGTDPTTRLVIDLGGLTFWDAFGLAGLLRAQGRADTSTGASLILANLPAQLADHLRETGLADRFTLAGTDVLADASASVPGDGPAGPPGLAGPAGPTGLTGLPGDVTDCR